MVRQNTLPGRVFQQFPTFQFAPFQSQRVEMPAPHEPATKRKCDVQNDFPQSRGD
jgi:hypothetical protein